MSCFFPHSPPSSVNDTGDASAQFSAAYIQHTDGRLQLVEFTPVSVAYNPLHGGTVSFPIANVRDHQTKLPARMSNAQSVVLFSTPKQALMRTDILNPGSGAHFFVCRGQSPGLVVELLSDPGPAGMSEDQLDVDVMICDQSDAVDRLYRICGRVNKHVM